MREFETPVALQESALRDSAPREREQSRSPDILADAPRSAAYPAMNAQDASAQRALRWHRRRHVQRYLRLLERLVHMSAPEIATRLSLAWHRRCPARVIGAVADATSESGAEPFIHALGADLRAAVAQRFDRDFFFGPSQQAALSTAIADRLPTDVERTLALAEAMHREGIDLLGQRVRLIAGELDWQADPCTLRRAWPQVAFDEAYAVSVPGTDVKYVWEVNRHQFLPLLGRAYWLSGNPKYAEQAAALIEDWIEHNPVGIGVNWCSHLEVAMRTISWLWTLPYLCSWPQLDSNFLQRWLSSLAAHQRHLAAHLSIFTDPTNHLIGEATALWMASVCFPELPDAAKQSARASDLLVREITRQIASDGVNCEQASGYHRFVLDFYLQFFILSKRTGRVLPDVVEQRLRSMLDFSASLAGVSGLAPAIGDGDDARGVPMPELTGWDFRDVLSTGAVLFGQPQWKSRTDELAAVTIWLLGVAAIEGYSGLPLNASGACSKIFGAGGYCFLPSNTDGRSELICDVGPLGLFPNAAHGHADTLSVLLRTDGRWFLGDPGTGTYFSDPLVRDAFRRTRSHNTVVVDGLDQADLFATFKWINPPRVSLLEATTQEHFDYVEAVHDGYRRLRKPVLHYRCVLAVKPRGWIVVDRFAGKGEHMFARHFNFPPGLELHSGDALSCVAADPTSGNALQLAFPDLIDAPADSLRLTTDGLWSERYGNWCGAPHVEVHAHGDATSVLFTLITPTTVLAAEQSGTPRLDAVERSKIGEATLCSYRTGSGERELILVNPAQRPVELGAGYRSNARFAFMQYAEAGAVQRAFIAGAGTALTGSGFELRNLPDQPLGSFAHAS